MGDEAERLTRLWVETFGEPPAVIDPELMRAVLADPGGRRCEERETLTNHQPFGTPPPDPWSTAWRTR